MLSNALLCVCCYLEISQSGGGMGRDVNKCAANKKPKTTPQMQRQKITEAYTERRWKCLQEMHSLKRQNLAAWDFSPALQQFLKATWHLYATHADPPTCPPRQADIARTALFRLDRAGACNLHPSSASCLPSGMLTSQNREQQKPLCGRDPAHLYVRAFPGGHRICVPRKELIHKHMPWALIHKSKFTFDIYFCRLTFRTQHAGKRAPNGLGRPTSLQTAN